MKRYNLYIILTAFLAVGLSSCDKFLDEKPDNRMDLHSKEDLSRLLVDAYPIISPAYILEMRSDNTNEYHNTAWASQGRFQEQAYNWETMTDVSANDNARYLWDSNYHSIAAANEVIKFVKGKAVSEQAQFDAQLGEALLCRAYCMFVLANTFCMAYDEATASQELGLPYPLEPESVVGVTYERGTLAELYQKIDNDLQEGLAKVKNDYGDTPKFHFTQQAGYAFAARFYLYYRQYQKAKDYAGMVLGDAPAAKLRDWAYMADLSRNANVQGLEYISTKSPANLLLMLYNSYWPMVQGSYLYGKRYAHGQRLSNYETLECRGPWGAGGGKDSNGMNYAIWKNTGLSCVFINKLANLREEDAATNTFQPHMELPVFSTDETLLVRAEAKIMLGDYNGGLQDINTELTKFHSTAKQISLGDVLSFYNDATGVKYYTPLSPTPRKKLHTSFTIESTRQEPLLQCVLQLRRLLTIGEGLRMQDVKRYGIKIYRIRLNESQVVEAVTDSLVPGDSRYAAQLPSDVLSAGLQPNPVVIPASSVVEYKAK